MAEKERVRSKTEELKSVRGHLKRFNETHQYDTHNRIYEKPVKVVSDCVRHTLFVVYAKRFSDFVKEIELSGMT